MAIPTVLPFSTARISPLAPAYFLGRPAQVWVEAFGQSRPLHPFAAVAGRTAAAA